MSMSTACWATIFLRRAFSDSNSLRRFIASAFVPPYWLRQRWKVASLMPSLLATSGTEAPAASSASAWRSLRTICSGVCLFFIESPPSTHLGRSDSHSNWISFRGAGHHNHAVSLVELRGARKTWQEDSSSDLGQRKLAHLQGGEALARQTQPRSEGERLWGEDRQLPSAEAESVAQRHRAEMGSWQAQGRGVRWTAGHVRTRRQGVRGVRLSPSRASHHPTGGRLIVH